MMYSTNPNSSNNTEISQNAMKKNEENKSASKIAGSESKYAHVQTKRSSLAVRGAAWSFLNSIVPTILNSIVFIVSSRYLTPQDFGIVALVASFVSFVTALAPMALGEALIQHKNVHKTHLDSVFWLCLVAALILYIVFIFVSPIIAQKIKHAELIVFLPILGLKLLFDLLATVPNALIARAMSFHLIAARTITATIISSVICIGLILLNYGIWALVISQLTISIASCLAALLGAKWVPGFEVKISALRELFLYGLFASGNRFLATMNLDQIIIGTCIGTAPLGIYNFSRRLFQMLNDAIAGALTPVSHALLSSLQSEKEKVREAFLMATFGSSIVSFPAFVGLAAIAGEAIPFVFGVNWSDAIEPTRWFCLIGLMSCIGVIQSSLISSQGKNSWWFYYQLFRQILTISTIVVLRDRSVSYIVMFMALQVVLFWPMTTVMVSKIIDIKIRHYFRQFLEPLFASFTMAMAVFSVSYFFRDVSQISRLLLEILAGAIVYGLTIFVISRQKILTIAKSFLNRNK